MDETLKRMYIGEASEAIERAFIGEGLRFEGLPYEERKEAIGEAIYEACEAYFRNLAANEKK